MVNLLHQGGPSTFNAFEDHELPQWTSAVEPCHGEGGGEVEHVAQGTCPRCPLKPQVIGQIEVLIDDVLGRRDVIWSFHDMLP